MLNKIESAIEKLILFIAFMNVAIQLNFLYISHKISFLDTYITIFFLLMFLISCFFIKTFHELTCKFIRFKIPYIAYMLPYIILLTYSSYYLLYWFGTELNIFFLLTGIAGVVIMGSFRLNKIICKQIDKFLGFRSSYIYMVSITFFAILATYIGCLLITKVYDFILITLAQLRWL